MNQEGKAAEPKLRFIPRGPRPVVQRALQKALQGAGETLGLQEAACQTFPPRRCALCLQEGGGA